MYEYTYTYIYIYLYLYINAHVGIYEDICDVQLDVIWQDKPSNSLVNAIAAIITLCCYFDQEYYLIVISNGHCCRPAPAIAQRGSIRIRSDL